MPFNIQPVRPLKRRAADDDDLYCAPVKQRRMDFDMDDSSNSTSSMDLDEVRLSTRNALDYHSASPEPSNLQKCYYGPGLIAFPHSLEVFNKASNNWYWNASCFLNNRALDTVESNQICTHFQNRCGWSPSPGNLPAIQLGTSEDMIGRSTPRFSTFVVFPNISGGVVHSEEFMRAWTDYVMVPSILHAARRREGCTYGVPAYARSYRGIRMASDCQRIVSNHEAPETPVSIKVRSDELGDLWQNMQSIVNRDPVLWEFQDAFLVVVAGQDSETGMECYGSDLRSFWGHFSIKFDRVVNMDHVPADSVTISPKVYYSGLDSLNTMLHLDEAAALVLILLALFKKHKPGRRAEQRRFGLRLEAVLLEERQQRAQMERTKDREAEEMRKREQSERRQRRRHRHRKER
ncbi:uncharacterized protein LTR77_010870 [Saxophila tyrrhenica]|uniref:Uncharacterized protein n=1 Tax=Saxophila tyrrhenica TaxID=1690608 RepID=A0AAV9NVC7_9PEZI|nr:hypothetical protein LTR77_010870 [Saxophila tyrrhenica]